MPSEHARFSPSAANRRIHCPPSLLLEEQFEEGESVYAAEGTAGHALAEHLIEGKEYMRNSDGSVNLCFTVSKEHLSLFKRALASVQKE